MSVAAQEILLVEDDPDAAELAGEHLERAGYSVRWAATAAAATAALLTNADNLSARPVGAVVLDLGLPDGDGIEILDHVRRHSPTLPVVVLTARTGEPERVRGLHHGADDYLEKPFSGRELVARLSAVLRRSRLELAEQVTIGRLTVDRARRTASVDGRDLVLTRLEFDLLDRFARHPGQVLCRDELVDSVWDQPLDPPSPAAVAEAVRRLRLHLREVDPHSAWISTVRGVGYRLENPPSAMGEGLTA